MLKFLAILVTATAAAIAGVASLDRGGNLVDRSLLAAISVAIVIAVHIIPSLSRRPHAWLIWVICVFGAVYGHLTFLTHAMLRAGEARAEQSVVVTGAALQIQTIQASLDSIQARPIAVVAGELSVAETRRARAALREELAEAKKAENLRAQLVQLYATSTAAKVSESTDPVIAKLSVVVGISEGTLTIAVGLVFSILLEAIGALLWYEVLKSKESSNDGITQPVTSKPETRFNQVIEATTEDVTVTDPITLLNNAIEAGQCRATVASIRAYLSCSQARAMELRRELSFSYV